MESQNDPSGDTIIVSPWWSDPNGNETDTESDRTHLTLLSAPYNTETPNVVEAGYTYGKTAGAGITIFVIDTGVSTHYSPDEFSEDERSIHQILMPREMRCRKLEDGEKLPPLDMADNGLDEDGRIRGHGTQVAILAAGSKTGVARKANLCLIKCSETVLDAETDEPVQEINDIRAHTAGLNYVIDVLEGKQDLKVPKGKAVVCITFAYHQEQFFDAVRFGALAGEARNHYKEFYTAAFHKLDRLGAVIVMSAGNEGDVPQYTNEYLPQCLAVEDSPYILVGSVNYCGQLNSGSTPGGDNCPVTIYAQGTEVEKLDFTNPSIERNGTSYAAPQVAGLAAYQLAHPKYQADLAYAEDDGLPDKRRTVGWRVKSTLVSWAYHRNKLPLGPDSLGEDPSEYKYDLPNEIPVAYNGVHGPQYPVEEKKDGDSDEEESDGDSDEDMNE